MADDTISVTVEDVVTVGRPISFSVYATIVERDALLQTQLAAGIHCFVLADGVIYKRNAGNTAWEDAGLQRTSQKAAANGYASLDSSGKVPLAQLPTTDIDISTSLTSSASFVHLYVSTTGNDNTGTGAIGLPFRNPQRALQVIAYSNAQAIRRGAAMLGNIIVHAKDAGAYNGFIIPRLISSYLYIQVIADFGSPSHTLTIGATERVPLTAASGRDGAIWECTVGAYGSAISNGSHWAQIPSDFGGGNRIAYAVLLDTAHCVSPKIRMLSAYDPALFFGDVEIRPYGAKLVGDINDPDNVYQFNVMENDNVEAGVYVEVIGFDCVGPATRCFPLKSCKVSGGGWIDDSSREITMAVHTMPGVGVVILGGSNVFHGHIFDEAPALAGAEAEVFLNSVFRGVGGEGECAFLGGLTGGRASIGAYEIEFASALHYFRLNGAAVRLGNHGPFSIDGGAAIFKAIHASFVTFVSAEGGTHGIPCVLEDFSVAGTGFDLLAGDIVNLDAAGDDVSIDNVVMAFANMPPEGNRSGSPINAVATTTNATPANILKLPFTANGTAKDLNVRAVAISATGTRSMERRMLAQRFAGVTTSTDQTPAVDFGAGIGGTPALASAVVSADMKIQITGIAATTIKWRLKVAPLEVTL